MAEPSTQITGGDQAAGADPGGTHSTKPGKRIDGQREVAENVTSGDRNDKASSTTAESNTAKP